MTETVDTAECDDDCACCSNFVKENFLNKIDEVEDAFFKDLDLTDQTVGALGSLFVQTMSNVIARFLRKHYPDDRQPLLADDFKNRLLHLMEEYKKIDEKHGLRPKRKTH